MSARPRTDEVATTKRVKICTDTTASSSNDALAPTSPRVTLDAQAFPHLLDRIIAFAPYASLLAFRRVNLDLRARVDATLCSHLVVRDVVGKRFPGVFFYSLRDCPDGWSEEPGHAIPCFAFYREACAAPYTANAKRLEERVVEDEFDFLPKHHGPLNLDDFPGVPAGDIRYRGPIRTEENIERSERWCREACAGVRYLYLIGDVQHQIDQLATWLTNVDTLLCSAGIGQLNTLQLRVKAAHFVHTSNFRRDPTELDKEDHRWTTVLPMTLRPMGPKTTTLLLKVYEGYHHDGHLVVATYVPPSLRSLTFVLESSPWVHEPPHNVDDLLSHSYEIGILIDVFEGFVPRLGSTQLTVVGLNPSTAPALGIDVPFHETSGDEGAGDDSGSSGSMGDTVGYLEEQFLRHLRTRVLNDAQYVTGIGSGPALEEFVNKSMGNVRFQTLDEWRAEVGDDWASMIGRAGC